MTAETIKTALKTKNKSCTVNNTWLLSVLTAKLVYYQLDINVTCCKKSVQLQGEKLFA